jgi:hypothetical protein
VTQQDSAPAIRPGFSKDGFACTVFLEFLLIPQGAPRQGLRLSDEIYDAIKEPSLSRTEAWVIVRESGGRILGTVRRPA